MNVTAPATNVGIAEMKITKRTGRLSCLGLGSCVGVAALDPVAQVGGMLHVMLPQAFAGKAEEKPGKFADTGVPAFIAELERAGANRRRLKIALAGGAHVFKFGASGDPASEIGARNGTAVAAALSALGLRPKVQDLGGSKARTMIMDVETGEVRLRAISEEERTLCNLAS